MSEVASLLCALKYSEILTCMSFPKTTHNNVTVMSTPELESNYISHFRQPTNMVTMNSSSTSPPTNLAALDSNPHHAHSLT